MNDDGLSIAKRLALKVATEALGMSEDSTIGLLQDGEAFTQWGAETVTEAIEETLRNGLAEAFQPMLDLAEDLNE